MKLAGIPSEIYTVYLPNFKVELKSTFGYVNVIEVCKGRAQRPSLESQIRNLNFI
jgi:hypothetical protein